MPAMTASRKSNKSFNLLTSLCCLIFRERRAARSVYQNSTGFARTGERIPTPVCGLVRNDPAGGRGDEERWFGRTRRCAPTDIDGPGCTSVGAALHGHPYGSFVADGCLTTSVSARAPGATWRRDALPPPGDGTLPPSRLRRATSLKEGGFPPSPAG
jgi:hypothetical protein